MHSFIRLGLGVILIAGVTHAATASPPAGRSNATAEAPPETLHAPRSNEDNGSQAANGNKSEANSFLEEFFEIRSLRERFGGSRNGGADSLVGHIFGSSSGGGTSSCDGFTAGARLYLLWPNFKDDTAFVTQTEDVDVGGALRFTDFDWNVQPGVLGWLGWCNCNGFGFQARYFRFEGSPENAVATNDAEEVNIIQPFCLPDPRTLRPEDFPGGPLFGSPGGILSGEAGEDVLTFSSAVRLNAVDLELTQSFNWCGCIFVASGGGRFLNMAQEYRGRMTNEAGTATEIRTVSFDRDFNGGGPMVALQIWVPFDLHLAFYGSTRGALVVGGESQTFRSTAVVSDPDALFTGDLFQADRTDIDGAYTIPVAEIELGFEYGREWGSSFVFTQFAVVQHTYFDAGSPSCPDGNMSLFGIQATLGFNR